MIAPTPRGCPVIFMYVRRLRALEGHRKKIFYWNLVFFVATSRRVGKVYIYRSDF
jgi:hypothetical protein